MEGISIDDTEMQVLSMLLVEHTDKPSVQQMGEQLWSWLEKVYEKLHHSHPLRTSKNSGPCAVLPQLTSLLRECVLTHRWRSAAAVLARLAAEPLWTSGTVRHVGLELMLQTDSEQLLDHLTKQLKLLLDINARQLALSHFMVQMVQAEFSDAKHTIRNFHQRLARKRRKNLSQRTRQVEECLYKAYEGLAYYTEWLLAKHATSSSVLAPGEQHYNDEDVQALAEKACGCLEGLESQQTTMDIFILAHTQVLESLNRNNKALTVLQTYANSNPTNPNAWRYLVDYMCRWDIRGESMENILQQLCGLVPSEPSWVLDYHSCLVTHKNTLAARIDLLMNCLDYAPNKDNSQLWGHLISDIADQPKDALDVVGTAWLSRDTWWPEYHFSTPSLGVSTKLDVMLYKAAFAHLVLGSENSFTQTVVSLTEQQFCSDCGTASRLWEKIRQLKPISCDSEDSRSLTD